MRSVYGPPCIDVVHALCVTLHAEIAGQLDVIAPAHPSAKGAQQILRSAGLRAPVLDIDLDELSARDIREQRCVSAAGTEPQPPSFGGTQPSECHCPRIALAAALTFVHRESSVRPLVRVVCAGTRMR